MLSAVITGGSNGGTVVIDGTNTAALPEAPSAALAAGPLVNIKKSRCREKKQLTTIPLYTAGQKNDKSAQGGLS